MKPLAYFPHPLTAVDPRDLLLLERLQPEPSQAALEIGTGNGSSLFRLGQFVHSIHGADVAPKPVERIRRFMPRFRRGREMDVFVMDFCDANLPARVPARYDLIFSCDTLEHVPDPAAFFRNVYALLKPEGRIFITFPNESPDRAHGITFFGSRGELVSTICAAGFEESDVTIRSVSLSVWAQKVLRAGWLWPRALYKKTLAKTLRHKPMTTAPQTFDQTGFFSTAEKLEPMAPVINAYCWAVMRMMAAVRPVYRSALADDDIWNMQILIEATRRGALAERA
jgi:SAM-dependent methyltransferase